MIPKIYVVNLDRSPQRLEYIKKQFTEKDIIFERLSAVDGALLDINVLNEYKNESKSTLTHYASLSNGEIGCSLSQKNGWNLIAIGASKAEVILEDDAKLSDDFKEVLSIIYDEMDDNIVVDLKGKKGFYELERVTLSNGIVLIHYSTPPLGTQGAIFGKKAAQKLLNNIDGFKAPIDNLMQKISCHGVEIWSLENGIISHATEESGGASIVRKSNLLKKISNEIKRPIWRLTTIIKNLYHHYKKGLL